mgnify:CR=1 FL=1
MSTPKWVEGFKEDYNQIFVEEWSPYFGAALVVLITTALIASGLFWGVDRKSTRLNSSHRCSSYAVFCLKKKKVN